MATLKLERGVTLEELIGCPAVGDDVGDIGLLAKSMIGAMNKAEKKSLVLFVDELDKVVNNSEIIEFILKHFDGINRTYKSPYLEGAEIDLPPIIIFAGNKHLTISDHETSKNALSHRTRTINLQRYSWAQQITITEKMLPSLMEANLGLPYRSLSPEELKGWLQALEPFRKEQEALPFKEKNGSIRPLIKKSIVYLTRTVYGPQIKEIRGKMDSQKKNSRQALLL